MEIIISVGKLLNTKYSPVPNRVGASYISRTFGFRQDTQPWKLFILKEFSVFFYSAFNGQTSSSGL
jgi:hypothetical protein